MLNPTFHDDVIKWKHFPRYWPFVRGIHRSPVISPDKGLWRGALMFSLIYVWINGWVNTGEAGDLRRHRAHYDVTKMKENVQREKYPGRCVVAESELPSFRKPKKCAGGHEQNGYKIRMTFITIYQGISKRTYDNHQHQNSAHPKPVLLTVMGCSWIMHNVTWYLYPYYDM